MHQLRYLEWVDLDKVLEGDKAKKPPKEASKKAKNKLKNLQIQRKG